jgi:hypothetical protein
MKSNFLTFFLVCCFTINANAQIKLSIAEDYVSGNTLSLFTHLSEKGYEITADTIWSSESGIDSVYEFTHHMGFDIVNVVKNKGLLISPIVNDSIDFYYDYIGQLFDYMTVDSEFTDSFERLEDGLVKIKTKKGIVYIVDPGQAGIMMYYGSN